MIQAEIDRCKEGLNKEIQLITAQIGEWEDAGSQCNGSKELLSCLTTALRIIEEWEKEKKLWAIDGLKHLEDDEKIASLEQELAKMKHILGWDDKEQIISRTKGLNTSYDYITERLRRQDEKLARYREALEKIAKYPKFAFGRKVARTALEDK